MQDIIKWARFAPDMIGNVQEFSCGDQFEWERDGTAWIKGGTPDNSVLEDMATRGTQVWLYFNSAEDFVGYGSLGKTTWKHPDPRTKLPLHLIPWIAIDHRFKGRGYGSQAMRHLLNEAFSLGPPPNIGLWVHPENQRAIDWYTRVGFAAIDPVRNMNRMLRPLP